MSDEERDIVDKMMKADHIVYVMKEKRGKHSKKPDFIRNLIKEWYPSAARLLCAGTGGLTKM